MDSASRLFRFFRSAAVLFLAVPLFSALLNLAPTSSGLASIAQASTDEDCYKDKDDCDRSE